MRNIQSAALTLRAIAAIILALLFNRSIVAPRSRADVVGGTKPTYRQFDDLAAASRIPVQQDYRPGVDPGPPPPFLEMSDPRAAECIVRDISPTVEGAGWRWTYLEPTLQFYLQSREEQRFAMDFSIVEVAFQSTGPVTLSCYVNDRLLTRLYCPRPGTYHLEHAVPASWLRAPSPIPVRAALDKVSVAPADRARLGYVLLRAGFLGPQK